jgi:DnaK suppressor protein
MIEEEKMVKLRAQLERAKNDIMVEIENLSEFDGVKDFGSDVDHFEEEADEAEEYGNQLSVIQALKERLNDIEHALSKFTNGSYGICENCREEIDAETLFAAPESRLCRNCKTNQRQGAKS